LSNFLNKLFVIGGRFITLISLGFGAWVLYATFPPILVQLMFSGLCVVAAMASFAMTAFVNAFSSLDPM
jgi:hypothetical protein